MILGDVHCEGSGGSSSSFSFGFLEPLVVESIVEATSQDVFEWVV